jgi:uncharacterized pyridoxal phosphate-containing UPF0001 family protein
MHEIRFDRATSTRIEQFKAHPQRPWTFRGRLSGWKHNSVAERASLLMRCRRLMCRERLHRGPAQDDDDRRGPKSMRVWVDVRFSTETSVALLGFP